MGEPSTVFRPSVLEALQLPPQTKKQLNACCLNILDHYQDRIESIMVIGSAVTPDFMPGESDINVLFVLAALSLDDLRDLGQRVQSSWRRHRFSPRFITRQNLQSAIPYFPIDFWNMKTSHQVICGADLLEAVEIQREHLVWQLKHQLKGLRMRIKQQYWRTAANSRFAKLNLVGDANSLFALLRVLVFLKCGETKVGIDELLASARECFEFDCQFLEGIYRMKQAGQGVKRRDIPVHFEGLFSTVRVLDDLSDELA